KNKRLVAWRLSSSVLLCHALRSTRVWHRTQFYSARSARRSLIACRRINGLKRVCCYCEARLADMQTCGQQLHIRKSRLVRQCVRKLLTALTFLSCASCSVVCTSASRAALTLQTARVSLTTRCDTRSKRSSVSRELRL